MFCIGKSYPAYCAAAPWRPLQPAKGLAEPFVGLTYKVLSVLLSGEYSSVIGEDNL